MSKLEAMCFRSVDLEDEDTCIATNHNFVRFAESGIMICSKCGMCMVLVDIEEEE